MAFIDQPLGSRDQAVMSSVQNLESVYNFRVSLSRGENPIFVSSYQGRQILILRAFFVSSGTSFVVICNIKSFQRCQSVWCRLYEREQLRKMPWRIWEEVESLETVMEVEVEAAVDMVEWEDMAAELVVVDLVTGTV